MPSPSKLSLFLALTVTAGAVYGGAWFASGLSGDIAAQPSPAERKTYVPAPIPGAAERNPLSGVERGDTQRSPRDINVATVSRAEPNAHLSLTVANIRNDRGKIIILVFDNAAAYAVYDYEKAAGYGELKATPGSLSYAFPQLDQGPYAVFVFHDENEDYEFHMEQGYPREGYGTSRAKGPYDELNFEEASVGAEHVKVVMHYLNLD